VESKHVFDTGGEGDGTQPFIDLLNSLPDGTVVLVAAMDDATDGLTPEARTALTTLGATQADSLSYRGSYALLGVKGGAAVDERVAGTGAGAVEIDYSILLGFCADSPSSTAATSEMPTTKAAGGLAVDITVKSAGWADGNFAEFWLDGARVELASGRGLSLVILRSDGSVESKHVFDTGGEGDGTQPFIDLLNSLPDGTVVLVAAMDDATDGITPEARTALTTLGATQADSLSYRGSYALIGIKGASTALAESVRATGAGPVTVSSSLSEPSMSSTSSSDSTSNSDSTSQRSTTAFSTETTSSSAEVSQTEMSSCEYVKMKVLGCLLLGWTIF